MGGLWEVAGQGLVRAQCTPGVGLGEGSWCLKGGAGEELFASGVGTRFPATACWGVF